MKFMRISQLRDHLQEIDEVIYDKELVTTTLNDPKFFLEFSNKNLHYTRPFTNAYICV